MRVGTLRTMISTAFLREEKNQVLPNHLKKVNGVASILKINQEQSLDVMQNFVMEYIHQVPDFLETLNDAAYDAGIEDHVVPFLQVAENYFIAPPVLPNQHIGLVALMDEAYLSHRIFEEVNDRYITQVGMPLIPWDMTLANVVAHQIIGEKIANQLDQIVYQTVSSMMPLEKSYDSDSFQQFIVEHHGTSTSIWQHWPCLSKSVGIDWGLNQ